MNNDFFQSYQTAEWQRLKNKVLERDNYTCQICGENQGLMQVHHITYKRCGGKAYNAPMGDLITLCEDCHNHDDGDHKHFYNGKVSLSCGFYGKSPSVLKFCDINKSAQWTGELFQIISFRIYEYPYKSIGFRCEDDFFPIVLNIKGQGNLWFNDEFHAYEATDQKIATQEEVYEFVRAVDRWYLGFSKCVNKLGDSWFVDYNKYCYLVVLRDAIERLEESKSFGFLLKKIAKEKLNLFVETGAVNEDRYFDHILEALL